MSSIPDLPTITARMESDVNHYLSGAELRPRFSVMGVLIKVYGAAVHALYLFAQNLLRNILPSTCHDEWLAAWGYVLRTPRKDGESLENWRLRLVAAFANRAKIGDADDYTEWALASHPRIQYAWVYGNTPALGDISIYVASADSDPLLTPDELAVAQSNLDRLRNMGCHVRLLSPSLKLISVTLRNVPESAHSTITNALTAHISTLRSSGQTLYVSDLHAAIRTVYDGIYNLAYPIDDVTADEFELIALGAIVWG
jgi:uncharacterized phage protein gp47/JayE